MNSVRDIGGNIGSDLDSVVNSALFLKLFPKTARNEYCSTLEKEFRFQVIVEFKKILELFPEQIRNSGIFRTRDILRSLSV